MAAQVKQLEQRLMALREEVREKEAKARQAEGSVQDLKLQLEDLQVFLSAKHPACNHAWPVPAMLLCARICLCWRACAEHWTIGLLEALHVSVFITCV